MASLAHLEELILDLEEAKSTIKLPPLAICLQGTPVILEYLRDVLKGVPEAKYCRVLGDGFIEASKLDLAGSYTNLNSPGAFSEAMPTLMATESANFHIISVDKFRREKKIGGDVFNASIQEVLVSDSGGLAGNITRSD